jgi:hypothetical protein
VGNLASWGARDGARPADLGSGCGRMCARGGSCGRGIAGAVAERDGVLRVLGELEMRGWRVGVEKFGYAAGSGPVIGRGYSVVV